MATAAGDATLNLRQLQHAFPDLPVDMLERQLKVQRGDLVATINLLAHKLATDAVAADRLVGDEKRTRALYAPLVKVRSPVGRTGVQFHAFELQGLQEHEIAKRLESAAQVCNVASINTGAYNPAVHWPLVQMFLTVAQRTGWVTSVTLTLTNRTCAGPEDGHRGWVQPALTRPPARPVWF